MRGTVAMRCFQRFKAGMDAMSRCLTGINVLLLIGIVILMTLEVFVRYFLHRSLHITDEYAGYMFCALSLLSFLPTLRSGRFLRITGVVQRLPLRLQAVAETIAALLGVGVSGVLAWTTAWQAWDSYVFGSVSLAVSQTPLFIPQAILPLGFVFLALGFAQVGATRAGRLWRGLAVQAEGDHGME